MPESDTLLTQLERVLQPAGWELLQSLPPYDESQALALGARLREQGHDPDTVAAVLTQARLRTRAREKFGEFADTMLLTPQGLEQATRLPVAALHARRFRDAGVEHLADLGCGIGGDAMAASALGLQVTAVDRDPATVAVATVNLRPFPDSRAELGTAEDFDLSRVDGVWMDPARRTPAGGRTRRLHDPEEYEPPLSTVAQIATRLPVGAKLGPGIHREALPEGTETQWLSWHGQVLEAVCWFGPLARPGVPRSALVVDRDGAHRLDASGPEGVPADPDPGPLEAHVYDPDGAVIRAGLLGRLAADLGAHTLDPSIAYLTAPTAATTPFARGYAVREVMPFSLKRLTAYLRVHRLGILEIKKRGTAVEPEELRRRLRPRRFGDESATLILTRIAGEQSVVVATPHASTPRA
nr:class I SAM-dependent methyltransferase [Brachybacterium sillae]